MSSSGQQHFLSAFDAFAAERAAGEPAWLDKLRRESLESFRSQGFPSTRLEAWRYTSLKALEKQRFALAPPNVDIVSREEIESLAFPLYACALFVFVNGNFAPQLSTPSGLSQRLHVNSLAALLRGKTNDASELTEPGSALCRLARPKQNPFAALATAFLDDGAIIRVPEGEVIEEPIHLVFLSTEAPDTAGPQVSHPRVVIDAGHGSTVTVIQDHVSIGSGSRLTNSVTEIALARHATVNFVLLQRECNATTTIASVDAELEQDARLHSHTISIGGALVRNDLRIGLTEAGAECRVNGLFVGDGGRHIDNHTLVDHAAPGGTSRQLYKGILCDQSRGVFRGLVLVRPDAQQTDARQSNPNLLLDDRAEINSKPQLEIHADDVQCSHGSTIGRIDDEALFYLRSRGLAESEARALLTRGFASEITRALPTPALGDRVMELVTDQILRPSRETAR